MNPAHILVPFIYPKFLFPNTHIFVPILFFPVGILTRILYVYTSYVSCFLHARRLIVLYLVTLITSCEQRVYEAPHYVIFSSSLLISLATWGPDFPQAQSMKLGFSRLWLFKLWSS
jgi:hypothetical protein